MLQRTVAYQLMQADHAQRAFVGRRLAALGLHVGQEQLLMRLWDEDGITQADLLIRIGCAAPTLTKAVQRLERVGLIRRERSGRPPVSRVFVTPAGWELRDAVEQVWHDAQERLAATLSASELAAFAAALEKVNRAYAATDDDVRAGQGRYTHQLIDA